MLPASLPKGKRMSQHSFPILLAELPSSEKQNHSTHEEKLFLLGHVYIGKIVNILDVTEAAHQKLVVERVDYVHVSITVGTDDFLHFVDSCTVDFLVILAYGGMVCHRPAPFVDHI